jgi:hypothetical protein
VGPDGFATDGLDIKNDTPFVVNELKFFIPTENFDQLFNAHTNTFTNAAISFDFEEGLTIVDYFGIGETQVDGGSASRFGCSDCEPGAPGFTPGGTVMGEAFIVGDPPPPLFPGLIPGADGSLDLTPNVPEPGTFVLLLSAAGLLATGRRLWR